MRMEQENIFQRIFSSLFNRADPEVLRKRQLRTIAKELSKSKYKFYKASSSEILPSFAKFFFDVYKLVSPAQAMFQNQNPDHFKHWVIDYVLSDEQHALVERLSEEEILQKSKTMPAQELQAAVRQDIATLNGLFDANRVAYTDSAYARLQGFIAFCNYDFYFMLKKFDSTLRENDFSASPKFENIRGEYLAEDLLDFMSIAWTLPLDPAAWTDIFAIIKSKKGADPIAIPAWNKMLAKLRDIKDVEVFEMIIRLVKSDPDYVLKLTTKQDRIIEPFIEKVRHSAESVLRKILQDQNNSKVEQLSNQIFDTIQILPMKNYTDSNSLTYIKRGLPGFVHAQAMSYLKTFLVEYIKTEIRRFCDIVLVRGEWSTTALSTPMSEAYNTLLEMTTEVVEFDNSVAENSELGTKLKTYIIRVERDMEAKRMMTTILSDINDDAQGIIMHATQNIIVLGKNIKALIEDHEKQRPELIVNWKDLDRFAETPIKQHGVEIYKKIYNFIQLMQMLLKGKSNTPQL